MYLTDQEAARACNDWYTTPPDDGPIPCYECDQPIADGVSFYYIDEHEICDGCIDEFIKRHRMVM